MKYLKDWLSLSEAAAMLAEKLQLSAEDARELLVATLAQDGHVESRGRLGTCFIITDATDPSCCCTKLYSVNACAHFKHKDGGRATFAYLVAGYLGTIGRPARRNKLRYTITFTADGSVE